VLQSDSLGELAMKLIPIDKSNVEEIDTAFLTLLGELTRFAEYRMKQQGAHLHEIASLASTIRTIEKMERMFYMRYGAKP
jgi:ABC-type transporter Mla MlaB component